MKPSQQALFEVLPPAPKAKPKKKPPEPTEGQLLGFHEKIGNYDTCIICFQDYKRCALQNCTRPKKYHKKKAPVCYNCCSRCIDGIREGGGVRCKLRKQQEKTGNKNPKR